MYLSTSYRQVLILASLSLATGAVSAESSVALNHVSVSAGVIYAEPSCSSTWRRSRLYGGLARAARCSASASALGYYRAKADGAASGMLLTNTAGVAVMRQFSGSDSASESAFAPLLELGGHHAITPDLRVFTDFSGIKKNSGSLNGHIYSSSAGVGWFILKNIGLAADYGIEKIQLDRAGDRLADLKVRLTGPSAYLKVRF